jgi:tRNA(Ile)-lysidine synthase
MPSGVTTKYSDATALGALFGAVAEHSAIALAVSGGADSLALMLLVRRWADGLARAPKVFVYSLDHQLRPEAADEVAMVLREAAALGFAARGLVWSGNKPTSGVQAAARETRYRLIAAAMAADGCEVLLTAHHREDQAETILMRMAHGSGLEGLRGMAAFSEISGVRVFRPLLDIDPQDLRNVVAQAGLHPVQDPSNSDPHYERVRWRQALPSLSALGLDGAKFGQLAQRIAEADEVVNRLATEAFSKCVKFDVFGAGHLDRAAFGQLDTAVGKRVLAQLLSIVGGRQKPRVLTPVETLYADVVGARDVPGTTILGTLLRSKGKNIVFARELGRTLPEGRVVPAGGELVWDGRFRIRNGGDEAVTIGLQPLVARKAVETLLGRELTAPIEAIRAAPVVTGEKGTVLAYGEVVLDTKIGVQFLTE